jgi:hypothetical protein
LALFLAQLQLLLLSSFENELFFQTLNFSLVSSQYSPQILHIVGQLPSLPGSLRAIQTHVSSPELEGAFNKRPKFAFISEQSASVDLIVGETVGV